MLSEAEILRYLKRRVLDRGGQFRRAQWIGANGCPDARVMLPGNCFWAELKRPGAKPTELQAREHTRMRDAGERVEVIDSLDDIDRLIP